MFKTSTEIKGAPPLKTDRISLNKYIRPHELVNGLTHLSGTVLACPGLYFLLEHTPADSSLTLYMSVYIFGISLFLLYTASATYHLLNISEQCTEILRRIDHIMIYILIAGTYTPICFIALTGWWGWGLLISIWSLTAIGISLKIIWFNSPRWLSTLLYVLMGWLVIIALYPLYLSISLAGVMWLALGGLSYTIGAVIYALKKPDIKIRYLGFHEIFHLFVLTGSFCHYWLIYQYILV